MNTLINSNTKSAWMAWFSEHSQHFTHAVTLTLKQQISYDTPTGRRYERTTPANAEKTFRFFRNRLNRAIYGNAWERFGKQALVVPVLEGGLIEHLHYHAAIGFPDRHLSASDVENKIRLAWNQTPLGEEMTQIDVVEIYNCEGWLAYIQKKIDATADGISVDLLSVPKDGSLSQTTLPTVSEHGHFKNEGSDLD